MISGDIQFSGSPASALSAIIKGGDLRVIISSSNRPQYWLWSLNDSVRLPTIWPLLMNAGPRRSSSATNRRASSRWAPRRSPAIADAEARTSAGAITTTVLTPITQARPTPSHVFGSSLEP